MQTAGGCGQLEAGEFGNLSGHVVMAICSVLVDWLASTETEQQIGSPMQRISLVSSDYTYESESELGSTVSFVLGL